MKTIYIVSLLSLAPSVVIGACSSDNVLRALQANSAKASPFCSTYTLPPPNQPLPTYVSQYPASRVSSGCSCLITPGPSTLTPSTTSTRATSTTTSSYVCQRTSSLIQNGGFETVVNGGAPPWEFALPVGTGSGQNAAASLVVGGSAACCTGNYVSLRIPNSAGGGYGETSITQSIPALCPGVSYTLTYNEQITVNQGGTNLGCLVEIGLDDRNLVFERLTFDVSPRTIMQTFTYSGTEKLQGLTFRFSCGAPYGLMLIDNVSLVEKLGPRIKE
ncbi:MAG: hypothetical protein Q9223_002166 [Gallowayella weberi]